MTVLNCTPQEGYEAWMDSKTHGKMIDGDAKIENKVGGKYSVWDGAVTGQTLELDHRRHKIVQNWRYEYDDWPKDAPSKITLEFVSYKNGCKLCFWQSNIPANHADEIAKGWKDYYWSPMQKYFEKSK